MEEYINEYLLRVSELFDSDLFEYTIKPYLAWDVDLRFQDENDEDGIDTAKCIGYMVNDTSLRIDVLDPESVVMPFERGTETIYASIRGQTDYSQVEYVTLREMQWDTTSQPDWEKLDDVEHDETDWSDFDDVVDHLETERRGEETFGYFKNGAISWRSWRGFVLHNFQINIVSC